MVVSTPVLHLLLEASEWNLHRFFHFFSKVAESGHVSFYMKEKERTEVFFLFILSFPLSNKKALDPQTWRLSSYENKLAMDRFINFKFKFVADLIRGIENWFSGSAWNPVYLYFTLFNNTVIHSLLKEIGKWKMSDLDLILACGNKAYNDLSL